MGYSGDLVLGYSLCFKKDVVEALFVNFCGKTEDLDFWDQKLEIKNQDLRIRI